MANIFEDAWNAGKEWATDVKEDAEKYVTKKIIQSKLNDFGTSVTEALGGPTKMTPELEAAGWELGIDNVPYNPQLAKDFAPGGKFYDPDAEVGGTAGRERMRAAQNAGVTSSTPAEAVPFIYQDLRQRTPSGTIYNPSMESFENASLFDYQGPGGLAEYTYGQGLPMGYDVYGTPVGPNLYYEGQFGEGFVEPGVADNAINLPPVTMPGDVPQITTPSNQATMPEFTGGGGTGPGGQDLTYAETLNEMGINLADAPSTTFPGPTQDTALVDTPASVLNVGIPDFLSDAWTGVKDFGSDLVGGLFTDDGVTETAAAPSMDANLLVSRADQGPDVGLLNYTNDGTVSAADQARFDAAKAAREASRGSGITYVDMGNNPDVGNLYTDPAERQLANEILGGEAYARAVYENSPAAQAVPGMADKNIAGFNLGRPQTAKEKEMISNVPDMFKVEAPSIFVEPGGSPFENLDGRNYVGSPYIGPSAQPMDLGGGAISASFARQGDPDPKVYTTADRNTGQVVHVNEHKGTVTPTGQFMRGGFGL
jgi:hypothetical protein